MDRARWMVVALVAGVALLLLALYFNFERTSRQGPTYCLDCGLVAVAGHGGACNDSAGDRFATYTIAFRGYSNGPTTQEFGMFLVVVGDAAPIPPGLPSGPDNCVRSPTNPGGWVGVLQSVSGYGQPDMAVFGSNGWTAINATLPATLTGQGTILVVAGVGVNLAQGFVSFYGTNGATVTGSVAL